MKRGGTEEAEARRKSGHRDIGSSGHRKTKCLTTEDTKEHEGGLPKSPKLPKNPNWKAKALKHGRSPQQAKTRLVGDPDEERRKRRETGRSEKVEIYRRERRERGEGDRRRLYNWIRSPAPNLSAGSDFQFSPARCGGGPFAGRCSGGCRSRTALLLEECGRAGT